MGADDAITIWFNLIGCESASITGTPRQLWALTELRVPDKFGRERVMPMTIIHETLRAMGHDDPAVARSTQLVM